MKQRLGIIGCGQLSQMLAEAANRQGVQVVFLCLDETPVVAGLGPIYQRDQLDVFLQSGHKTKTPCNVRCGASYWASLLQCGVWGLLLGMCLNLALQF